MTRRKATKLETSGAASVASKAIQEEADRLDQGQEPTPLTQMADVLIQMQRLMAQQQAESERRVLAVVDSQSAALREHLEVMEHRFIAMGERQRAHFDSLIEEARERYEDTPPEVRAKATARAAIDIQRRTMNMRAVMDADAREIQRTLDEEDQVPWSFEETTTVRMTSWNRTYPRGIHNVPRSVAVQLMQGRIERERLDRLKGIMSADRAGSIPHFGSNPAAIYSVADRVGELIPNKVD